MMPDERRSMRREQVERCLASHMTIRDWCKLNRVPESTMYVWVKRFRDEEPESFGGPSSSD